MHHYHEHVTDRRIHRIPSAFQPLKMSRYLALEGAGISFTLGRLKGKLLSDGPAFASDKPAITYHTAYRPASAVKESISAY